MVSSLFMTVAPLGVRHREPTPAGAAVQSGKSAPANRSRSPAWISGQAVAAGERRARAAATTMRWQLTCMAITVAGARRTAQPHFWRLPEGSRQRPLPAGRVIVYDHRASAEGDERGRESS